MGLIGAAIAAVSPLRTPPFASAPAPAAARGGPIPFTLDDADDDAAPSANIAGAARPPIMNAGAWGTPAVARSLNGRRDCVEGEAGDYALATPVATFRILEYMRSYHQLHRPPGCECDPQTATVSIRPSARRGAAQMFVVTCDVCGRHQNVNLGGAWLAIPQAPTAPKPLLCQRSCQPHPMLLRPRLNQVPNRRSARPPPRRLLQRHRNPRL